MKEHSYKHELLVQDLVAVGHVSEERLQQAYVTTNDNVK